MNWAIHSLHFKQAFSDGYRYLDRCGEFVLEAKKYEFMPGEVVPTGGQLTIPETRLNVGINSTEITMHQEMPPDDSGYFLKKILELTELAERFFGPLDVQSNGIAGKWYLEAATPDEAREMSLRFKSALQDNFAKKLGMVSSAARTDFNFSSGSQDLHIVIQPVGFQTQPILIPNPPSRMTRAESERTRRLKSSASAPPKMLAYALLIELDLVEYDPPKDALPKHFDLLMKKADSFIRDLWR